MNVAQGWGAILAHPIFATVVPVWCATAFALSSLAVRGAILERWVLDSGLDMLLPMAAPPLGHTARLLIAASLGAIGALAGWLVVRLIVPRRLAAKRKTSPSEPIARRRADAHPDAPAREPIQAHAELGAHGFDHPAPPGAGAQPVVAIRYEPFPSPNNALMPEVAPRGAHAPLLSAPPPARQPEPVVAMAPVAGFPSPPLDRPSSAERIACAPLAELSHVELIERLAIALRRLEAKATTARRAADARHTSQVALRTAR